MVATSEYCALWEFNPNRPINLYRFADHKEHVIDLLKRVCTVSVETVRITNRLAELSDIEPPQDQQSEPEVITLSKSG